jgi:DNA helicase II / ATP-dependent DNA helicase PcrA
MKASEIKVGGCYEAKVSNKLVQVKVLGLRESGGYRCLNLSTKREVIAKTAARFRRELPPANFAKQAEEAQRIALEASKRVGEVLKSQGFEKTGEIHDEQIWEKKEKMPVNNLEGPGDDTPSRLNVGPGSFVASVRSMPRAPDTGTEPHLIVEARAGTGKTTTLVEGIRLVLGGESKLTPSPQQRAVWDEMLKSKGKVNSICFVAFNKSIANELQNRVPSGCVAMTMHSMGFKAVQNALGRLKVDGYRVQSIIQELTGRDIRDLWKNRPTLIQATEKLVGLCKMNMIDPAESEGDTEKWAETLDELAAHYDIDLNGDRKDVYDLVPRVLVRCTEVRKDSSLDFNDMIWLPVVLKLPVTKYGMLLVDEAQDLNRCQQALAKMAGYRLILCGDPRQAIYGFAGADAESMPRMADELSETPRGCVTLPLTVTRRCGKLIVAEAQKIVSDFEAFETNPDGIVRDAPFKGTGEGSKDYTAQVADGDFILCRVNAPLVSQCFRFLKQGRKANIQGRDIGQGLVNLVKKQKASSIEELVVKLDEYFEKEVKKENSKKFPSEAKLIALEDRQDCLSCFCEGQDSPDGVIARIESVFTDDKDSRGIRLSSIHKAKGLEADRVFFLLHKDAPCPHPMAESGWQIEQEWNLKYVAITRAKMELVFVR